MVLPLENQIKKHDVVKRPEVVEDFDEVKTRTVIKKRKNRQAQMEDLFKDDKHVTKEVKETYLQDGVHTEVEDEEDNNHQETEVPAVQEEKEAPRKKKKKKLTNKKKKGADKRKKEEEIEDDAEPYRLDDEKQ